MLTLHKSYTTLRLAGRARVVTLEKLPASSAYQPLFKRAEARFGDWTCLPICFPCYGFQATRELVLNQSSYHVRHFAGWKQMCREFLVLNIPGVSVLSMI